MVAVSAFSAESFERISIASFGPIDLHPGRNFGRLSAEQCETKKSWHKFNPKSALEKMFGKPAVIETDVNSSAFGEYLFADLNTKLGLRSIDSMAYVTVGTGVGVGVVINGLPVHGFQHPEGGHMLVPLLVEDEAYPSSCKFHQSCVEGRCNTEYLSKVIGCKQEDLNKHQSHPVFSRVEYYLAVLCVNIFLLISPQCIVLGGGICLKKNLVSNVSKKFHKMINSYIEIPKKREKIIIQLTTLNDKNAILGASALHLSSISKQKTSAKQR